MESNVISLSNPAPRDALTELLRYGAAELLKSAVEAEVSELLESFSNVKTLDGRHAVVRNGYLPEREVQTGIGAISVKVPKVRDRSKSGIKFNSRLLPPYLRRSQSIEELIPWLYLKGVSTGDFGEALSSLLGEQASGLSPSVISRLKQKWSTEYEQWSKRSLANRKYVYFWVDAVYFGIRGEGSKQCMLVVLGATESGKKELVGIEEGYRESAESWRELLRNLKSQGLSASPKCCIGDGALGFWKALQDVFPEARQQRCWQHKTVNVLDKLPKSLQGQARSKLKEIHMATSKEAAQRAWKTFVESYEQKHPRATECLNKNKEEMLTYFDFPAEHWVHLRTTNAIESLFSTVRLRTAKTRGCVSRASNSWSEV